MSESGPIGLRERHPGETGEGERCAKNGHSVECPEIRMRT
jgi:hypothetical protein